MLAEVTNRRRTVASAAAVLALGVRQVHRLPGAYRGGGRALAHKARGRPSNDKIPAGVRERAVGLVRGRHRDFGPTLAAEMLAEKHALRVSRETLRGWMVDAGLWLSRSQRRRFYQPRLRREASGELVQIDGSEHRWSEDRADACTLLVLVDDATGRLMQPRLAPSEGASAYLQALRGRLEAHGRPVASSSDRHSVSRVAEPSHAPSSPPAPDRPGGRHWPPNAAPDRLRAGSGALMRAIDALNARYGRDTVFPVAVGVGRGRRTRTEHRSPRYATRPSDLPVAGCKEAPTGPRARNGASSGSVRPSARQGLGTRQISATSVCGRWMASRAPLLCRVASVRAVVAGVHRADRLRGLRAAREVWEAAGHRVRGAALSGIAAEGLQGGSGIESRTIASLEHAWSKDRDRLGLGDVLVVDEAGMVGSRQTGRVLAEAAEAGAKIVLVGDPAQLQAINAGAAFRALVAEHGSARLTDIRRQHQAWQRVATGELAEGSIGPALRRYAGAGMVHAAETRGRG